MLRTNGLQIEPEIIKRNTRFSTLLRQFFRKIERNNFRFSDVVNTFKGKHFGNTFNRAK